MKSLGTFKSIVTKLRKSVEHARNAVIECEQMYYGNPCKRTLSALDKAVYKLEDIEERLGRATEMVENYDFYFFCWKQEENEAIARNRFITNI